MVDFPPHPSSRGHRLALFVVLAIAAGLRFWGIGAGAPYRIANDEPFVVGTALQVMQSGDFNPHFFHYGGLSIYLHTVVAVARFMYGATAGEWTSLSGLWIGDFLTWARVFTAALGTLTVFVVYRAGLRLGARLALVAAFIMAVLPPHVRESHFALTDTPLTLFAALALMFSLRAVEQARLSSVALAGLAAGLAASVKYNGALALIMPLTATFALAAGSRLRGAGIACAGAAAGFLLTSPYSILDLPAFLNGFADLAKSYNESRAFLEAELIYLKHLRGWFTWGGVVPLDAGYIAVALSIVGGVLLAIRRTLSPTRVGAAIVLVFPVIWFVLLARHGYLLYGRYLLPLAPMLCLCLAAAAVAAWEWSARSGRAPRWSARAAMIAVLALPMGSAVDWVHDNARPHTEELASAWVVQNVPAGQPIVVEAAALLLPPSVNVVPVNRLVDRSLSAYAELGATYLVTTSAETDVYFARPRIREKELVAFKRLLATTEPVITFEPDATTSGPRISILLIPPDPAQ